MGKIQVLPEQLINQIAAGEVVERPASVVKELAENALDAQSKAVRIEIVEGGLKRIQVSDDGLGMSRDDAETCLLRHATSKLKDAAGLTHIATMGFRGEAVPAIASVARFTLTTREREADAATRVKVEGGKLEAAEQVGAPAGTTVLVEDLFFNTPARRKFLKRPETESAHCSEAVTRLVLARPDVGFTFFANGRQTLTAPASPKDPRERIAAALGTDIHKHLIALDETMLGIRVQGFLASPDYTLGTTKGLYTFVNGRFVRDRGLIAAVQRAYADVMMPGRQPAAVLYVEVPLEEVDVNVHPQKLEVRFSDNRRVFDAVYGAAQRVLRSAPWLKQAAGAEYPAAQAEDHKLRIAEALTNFAERPPPREPPRFAYASARAGPVEGTVRPEPFEGSPRSGAEGSYFGSLRIIGQFQRSYLVCEAPGAVLVLIDQHAAHERLKFDALRRAYRERKGQSQAFLFPATVELPLAEAKTLASHLAEVRAVGFDVEPFGGTSYALKSVPAPLVGCDYKALLVDMAGQLLEVERGRAVDDAMDEVLATMACHAAVRANQALSNEEARALLDALDGIDFNTRCPHGRPVAAELTLAELEKRVGRR